MVSKKEQEELPSGWKEHINVRKGKTSKYYTNVETGQKFGSWKSLNRYLNSKGGISESSTPSSIVSTDRGRSDNSSSSLMNEYPEWLPQGWTVETRKRFGSKNKSVFKVYVETSTGCKLYSKPQVLKYLNKAHPQSNAGNENNEVNEHIAGKLTISEHSESVEDKGHISEEKNGPGLSLSEPSEAVEDKCHISGEKNGPKLPLSGPSESVEDKCHASGEKNGCSNTALEDKRNTKELDELPPGWILEMRTRKYKGKLKRDPYYTDPVTGYKFRSRLDVFRYLETGDIRKCASKPLKRDALSSPSSANAKKKKQHSASTGQLPAADTADKDSEISKEKEADSLPFDSTFKASDVVVVEEKPGDIEAVESHKSEENSTTKNNGVKLDSTLVGDDRVSSPAPTAPSRKSKRKPSKVSQRSSKRLAKGHTSDINEPTSSAAVKGETSKSSSLSSKTTITGETRQLDTNLETASSYAEASHDLNVQKTATIVVTETQALFTDLAANEMPPQQLTKSSNVEVIEVPPQVHDSNIYTVTNNAAVNVASPQQLVANIYTESSDAAANEVLPQQLDDNNIYIESSHAAVNKAIPHPHQVGTNVYIESGVKQSPMAIDAAVGELPPGFETNFDATASQSRIEMDLNSTLELLFEDMDVQQQQQTSLGEGNDETRKGVDPKFQGDYWSDPCFDFAFKTLAGEVPYDGTMELDSCFQQNTESSSYTQGQGGGVGSVVPDMNAPNNGIHSSDPVPPKGMSMEQLPGNLTSQSVKPSLPHSSTSDSQPP